MMRTLFSRLCPLLVALCMCCSVAGAAEGDAAAKGKEGWPTHLRLLTGPNGGQWFTMGAPMAEVISNAVVPTTSRQGGGLSNITSLNEKNGDLGFSLSSFLGAAESGEEEYKNIRFDNATILANVYPQVLYFLVRSDFAEKHGITDVESLLALKMPLRFASLKPGTASEFILNLVFKFGYNTSFEKLREQGWITSFNNYAETADNFVAGEIDCFAYTAGTTVPLIQTMEGYTPVKILPLSDNVLKTMAEKFQTSTYTITDGTYKSVTKPVNTLGDYTCILVRKDLPDSLVYSLCKALWEGRDSIASVIKDFGGLSLETALPASLPVHPGAAQFWNEAKGQKR